MMKRISIDEARQLCKTSAVIHWRPDENLPEFDEQGNNQQYAEIESAD